MSALLDARYHVPRSQVWEGSRGRASGCVHLHVTSSVEFGRITREPQQALCGKRGWYERPAEGERICPRCDRLRDRLDDTNLSICPMCGGYVEDLDGFGVLAHDACGYCSHPDRYGGECTICRHVIEDLVVAD